MQRSLRRNSTWQLLLTLFSTGSELVLLLALTARLSPDAFGAFIVASSSSKLTFLLLEPRIHDYLTPRLARFLGRSRRAVWSWVRWCTVTELVCNMVALVACALVLPNIPYIEGQAGRPLLFAVSLYMAAGTLAKFSVLSIFRCLYEIRVAAAFAGIAALVKLAVLAVAFSAHWELAWLFMTLGVLVAAISAVQLACALLLLAKRAGPHRLAPARPLRRNRRQAMTRELLSNYGTGLVETVHREVDVQLAVWLAGPVEAGRYRVAKTLSFIILEALNPVVLVLLPEFAKRIHAGTRDELSSFTRRVTRGLGLAGLGATALALVVANFYLHAFAPAQLAAWPAVVVLCLAMALVSPWLWSQSFLVASGRSDGYLRCSALGAAGAIVLALLLVGSLGALGSALAFAAGLLIATWTAGYSARALLAAGNRGHE